MKKFEKSVGSGVDIPLPVPSTIVEQVVADWEGTVVIFYLIPGVYGAIGVDGDLIEALTGTERPRWNVTTADNKSFRTYPILETELEDSVISTLQASELGAVVIEELKRKED